MIELATRRNRKYVEAGRALLEAVALEEADLGKRRFDKVFGFNVAPFWLEPEVALGVMRKHLAPLEASTSSGTLAISRRGEPGTWRSSCVRKFGSTCSRSTERRAQTT